MRSTIRTRAVLVATLAVLVGAIGLFAAPASAGLGSWTFSMDPTSGPAGTTVSFASVTDCSYGADTAIITNTPTPSDADVLASAPVDVELGDWSLTYDIPADAQPGIITFWAFCVGTPIDQSALSDATIIDTYQSQDFTVTGSGTTVPPTTAPPTTGTTIADSVWLELDNTTYQQGTTMLMDTGGWMPGAEVGIVVFSDPTDLGVALADSLGTLQHNWTIPANFPVGSHTVTLTGLDLAGSIVTISAPFNVTALAGALTTTTTAAIISSGTLPATGITPYTLPLTVVGGLLALGGVALVAVDRQRKAARVVGAGSAGRAAGSRDRSDRSGSPGGPAA